MIRDITLGQYYPADSVLHKLDPRVKITGTLIFVVSLFLVNNWGYLICAAFLVSMIIMSKVPFSFMAKGLKVVMVILIITVALNLFLTQGRIVWQAGILHITYEGIRLAITMAVRLVFLVIGASIMTLTTTPNALTDGIEKLFSPLNALHVPVHEIAMMMSIALRFIPILVEETDKIMKAQMARGADFENGKIMQKIKAMVPILVPLFVSAFRRANDLALAMEARCYHGGAGRTQMKPLRYESRDTIAYIILFAFLAAMILIRIFLHW